LTFLADEGYYVAKLLAKATELGLLRELTPDRLQYLLVAGRDLVGAVEVNPATLGPLLVEPFKGLLSEFVRRRLDISEAEFAMLGVKDSVVILPQDRHLVMEMLVPRREVLHGLTRRRQEAIMIHLKNGGVRKDRVLNLASPGCEAHSQVAFHRLTGVSVVGYYFAASSRGLRVSQSGCEVRSCYAADPEEGVDDAIYKVGGIVEVLSFEPEWKVLFSASDNSVRRPIELGSRGKPKEATLAAPLFDGVESFLRDLALLKGMETIEAEVRLASKHVAKIALSYPKFQDLLQSLGLSA
jgi:hypothetical protein